VTSMPEPNPAAEAPMHVLVVSGPISDDGEMEYDIVHPAECPAYPTHWGGIGHECLIGGEVEAVGTMEAVGVERDFRTGNVAHYAAGEYRITGWTDRHDVPGYPIEYDSGIEFVDEVPAAGPVQHVPATVFSHVTFEMVPEADITEDIEETSC
jgi:hypothetical protein